MDKELPWLADNAQLELKYKKGKTPLSHRRWPGEPVSVITGSLIQTLGDELLQKAEKKKNIVWRYENFSLEWQSAITQAINLIGEHKPSIPARTMAALACIAQNDSQQLLDEIVQQEGLEYGFAPIFPDTCYHLTHYWLAAVDIPVASDNPVHYADAIRYNARTPLQGSLLPLTRLV